MWNAIADAKAAGTNARGMVLADRERNATTIAELKEAAAQLPTSQQAAAEAHLALQQQIDLLGGQLADVQAKPGPQGEPGPAGTNGLSAYDLARQQGYGGTLTQWLASIKGADGATGAQGLRGPSGADGVQGLQGIKGDTGSTGAKGDQGATGVAGTANLAVGAAPVGLLALGGFVNVTIPLSRTMPNTTYNVQFAHSAVVSLANVTYSNISKTTTAVTVRVTSVGLALAGGTLIVVAW